MNWNPISFIGLYFYRVFRGLEKEKTDFQTQLKCQIHGKSKQHVMWIASDSDHTTSEFAWTKEVSEHISGFKHATDNKKNGWSCDKPNAVYSHLGYSFSSVVQSSWHCNRLQAVMRSFVLIKVSYDAFWIWHVNYGRFLCCQVLLVFDRLVKCGKTIQIWESLLPRWDSNLCACSWCCPSYGLHQWLGSNPSRMEGISSRAKRFSFTSFLRAVHFHLNLPLRCSFEKARIQARIIDAIASAGQKKVGAFFVL